MTDTGTADISTADISTADISTADISTADISTADISTADISTADTSTPDTSTPDTSIADTSIADLLKAATAHAVPVVRAIPEDRLAVPTPCAEYDVKALVNHLLQVVVQFQTLAAKRDAEELSETPDIVAESRDSGSDGSDWRDRFTDWRDRFTDETAKLVAAWAVPGADEGTTGAMGMPARTVGCMALLDLTVHAWDLARATGQEYEPAPESSGVVAALREAVAGLGPTARKMGVFGEPVAVPEGASELERLLAETGRDPHWTAPAAA